MNIHVISECIKILIMESGIDIGVHCIILSMFVYVWTLSNKYIAKLLYFEAYQHEFEAKDSFKEMNKPISWLQHLKLLDLPRKMNLAFIVINTPHVPPAATGSWIQLTQREEEIISIHMVSPCGDIGDSCKFVWICMNFYCISLFLKTGSSMRTSDFSFNYIYI